MFYLRASMRALKRSRSLFYYPAVSYIFLQRAFIQPWRRIVQNFINGRHFGPGGGASTVLWVFRFKNLYTLQLYY